MRLHMTVNVMEQSMDEDELRGWADYFAEETPDVNELQMAVLSNMIASYMGNKNSKYTDFLIRTQRDSTDTDKPITNDAIIDVFRNMVVK